MRKIQTSHALIPNTLTPMIQPSRSLVCLARHGLSLLSPMLAVAPLCHADPPSQPTEAPKPQTRGLGPLTVDRAKTLHWNLLTGDMEASGGVRATYTDPNGGRETRITAQSLTYNGANGQANAHGGVRLDREEGTFLGQDLAYDFQNKIGTVTDAVLETDYIRARGKRISERPDGAFLIEDGSFTTCLAAHPDYLVKAKRIVYLRGEYVSARGVTFYAGKTRLPTFPSFRRSLKAGTSVATPIPGYNRTDGLYVRLHDTPIQEPHTTLDYDARFLLKRFPTGAVAYESDLAAPAYNAPPPRDILPVLSDPLRGFLDILNPPTYTEYSDSVFAEKYAPRSDFVAVVQNDQFVYNRRFNGLRVSRFPEVGVRFVNLLGHRATSSSETAATTMPSERIVGNTEGVLRRVPNAPFLVDFYTGIGAVHENPTDVTAGRLSANLGLASQPIIVGRRLSLRAGLSNWFNLYTSGTAYALTSPELELDYVPTRTSRFSVGYRYVSESGRTPFLFDRRDIRNELRLQYQVGGPWAFGLQSRINLDRSAAYDTEAAVIRNFDCMQVGFSYRFRSQQFNVIFNILPPSADRARRRLQPLNVGSASFDRPQG